MNATEQLRHYRTQVVETFMSFIVKYPILVVLSYVKASIDSKRAGSERAGAIIRTMSLNNAHSDRTRGHTRLLSECPLYKVIVLIIAAARSLPACYLSVKALMDPPLDNRPHHGCLAQANVPYHTA